MLEKTVESPLDCKEIQSVHSEGDQSWVFIGRTDAKAEYFVHIMRRVDSLEKTRQTFVGKVMSPLLNMLSRLVITFLTRSKRLLISWLQSPSAASLETKKIKSDTVSPLFPHLFPMK